MKTFIIVFLLAGLFLQFSCGKPCNEPDHLFSLSSSFAIEKDSIPVGDTLWLVCESPTNMFDLNTNSQVDFSNAENFGSALFIADINKFHSSVRGAVDSFDFVKIKGNAYSDLDPNGTKQLSFEEASNMYSLKIGIIAKKRGLYILGIADLPSVVRRKGQKNCGKAAFQILNNNINKHSYLLEDLWGPLSEHDKKHSYCVKVY